MKPLLVQGTTSKTKAHLHIEGHCPLRSATARASASWAGDRRISSTSVAFFSLTRSFCIPSRTNAVARPYSPAPCASSPAMTRSSAAIKSAVLRSELGPDPRSHRSATRAARSLSIDAAESFSANHNRADDCSTTSARFQQLECRDANEVPFEACSSRMVPNTVNSVNRSISFHLSVVRSPRKRCPSICVINRARAANMSPASSRGSFCHLGSRRNAVGALLAAHCLRLAQTAATPAQD